MSEAGLQTAIARARSGMAVDLPSSDVVAHVREVLATIPDPELPVLSIADLGMIHRVDVDAEAIRVTILPTFIGCPALEVIRASIEEALATFNRPVMVLTSFEPPWTSDRITPDGRASLAAAGIAPPDDPADIRCPYCASAQIVMDSVFGPTQCRSLFYCRGCRQPFEGLKRV